MNKDTKIYLGLVVIVIVIIIAIFYIKDNGETPEQKLAKCIGENSVLYIKLGCPACEVQKTMFGDNYQYLNKIDCHYEIQKCIDAGITHTPTWIIKEQKIEGVQPIEKLKELTGC